MPKTNPISFTVCGIGHAFQSSNMRQENHPATNPQQCLNLCNNAIYCSYWHHDGFRSCSLFSSAKRQTKYVGANYTFGLKHCRLTGT